MKIYTKKGDQGKTSLIGGTRVNKDHNRINAYGTVDELNSWIGLLRDQSELNMHSVFLLEIQDRLFTIGSQLAEDPEASRMKIPSINSEDTLKLEKEIDKMETVLPEMKSFILPGGHIVASYCHIARCVCRRAERLVVHLQSEEHTELPVLPYLNRLSDYLFVLSRWTLHHLKAAEIPWKPKI